MTITHDDIMQGHLEMKNTLGLVAEEFLWPEIQSEIKKICPGVRRLSAHCANGKGATGNMPTIETPIHKLATGIVGPTTQMSSAGNNYILTMVDTATSYPDAVRCGPLDISR